MSVTPVDKLRNIAILSHSGSGKTSVCEAMLFNAKVTTRLGNVEDGNTVSDYEPEEVKRASSIQTSVMPCPWKEHKLNFLDTPGYDDFVAEVICGLRVVEGAIIVVPAPSGVEVGAERSWAMCEERDLPRFFFVNKMDRENADFHRCVADIESHFGRKCVPLQITLGSQQDFKGVIDLFHLPEEVPGAVKEEVSAARERLVEAVAESDDDLATRYLEEGQLSDEELSQGLKRAVLSGAIVPILAGSAMMNSGVEELQDAAVHFMPSPVDAKDGVEEKGITADAQGPLVSLIFKTAADPFVGKLSLFRVYRGTFNSNSEVWNSNRSQAERVGQLFAPRGKTQETVQEVGTGDIGAVGKLTASLTGDTLCVRDQSVSLDNISFPVGYYTMSVSPKTKADLDKMSISLARIVEEDPSLRLSRDQDTSETLISGLGDTQLDVTMERVRRKFGADLLLQLPKVPYKETITTVARAEYKHKKQTGGHGQYGHVLLRLEPLERNMGFEFGREVVGGSVPREYIPSVEKGVVKSLQEGVLAGYPIVDLKVVLYDGSFHDVDSSGMSFEIAGSYALRKGVSEGTPVLLEPIMKLSITVPDNVTGDVMGDLNGKRGRILGMTPGEGETLIEAEVPQAELLRYATEVRSMTQGRGSYSLEFDHFDPVPQNLAARIIEEAKKAKEAARA